jgi:hypothetical protein
MFRNPVYDLMVVVPALLIAGLLSFFVMSSTTHAQAPSETATTTGTAAVTASTSGTTFPDLAQKVIVVTRASAARATASGDALTALSIHSSDELEAYAQAMLKSDRYLESIALSSRGISVSYRSYGRLLGVMPLNVPMRATVRTDGSVAFSEPWYGTLTLKEKDHMKSALEVRVHTLLTSEGYLASMSLAPATQAEILDIIRELIG